MSNSVLYLRTIVKSFSICISKSHSSSSHINYLFCIWSPLILVSHSNLSHLILESFSLPIGKLVFKVNYDFILKPVVVKEVFSSHILEEVRILCDNVAVVSAGCIVAQGSPEFLCRQTSSASLEDAFVKLTNQENFECSPNR